MKKEEIRREDGRYLVYYWFEDEEPVSDDEEVSEPPTGDFGFWIERVGRGSPKSEIQNPTSRMIQNPKTQIQNPKLKCLNFVGTRYLRNGS